MLMAYTYFHVALSLVGIISGLVMLMAMASGKKMDGVTSVFLWTTILTSVTGFFFPFHGITPGIIIGILSLVVLALALYALRSQHLNGAWRTTFAICAVIAEYFNIFVLVAQSFRKIPALHALAPTQSDGPFKITQTVVLVLVILLGVRATRGFRKTATA
ncbi:MAG TPA: hypothetical protein VGI16_03865 [Candidatus Acidoferrum sp.]|jgi:hypothetical protein